MTANEENLSLITQYRKHLEKLNAEPVKAHYDFYLPTKKIALDHLYSMLPEMGKFIRENQREKFSRWLGFIQGVLWLLGEFTLNELRNHNRPRE